MINVESFSRGHTYTRQEVWKVRLAIGAVDGGVVTRIEFSLLQKEWERLRKSIQHRTDGLTIGSKKADQLTVSGEHKAASFALGNGVIVSVYVDEDIFNVLKEFVDNVFEEAETSAT